MAGYLGDDFDPLQPEDSDSVKFGASWIRDLKARVQRFAMTLFNLETGALRDRVVRHASLRDMPGLVAGTYNKVKVNSKGLVTEGANEGEQQAAKYFSAVFMYGGAYRIDTDGSVISGNGGATGDGIYLGSGTYTGSGAPFTPTSYGLSGNYSEFSYKAPKGVRRVKATIVGGGGGSQQHGSGWHGGGGGELVEATFSLDGSGDQALTIIVGNGGDASGSSAATSGCPSRVYSSDSVFADAGAGLAGTASAGGGVVEGDGTDSTLLILRSSGTAGADGVGGLSGASALAAGDGGKPGAGGEGVVILEWVL
jgi:hypothetical protein